MQNLASEVRVEEQTSSVRQIATSAATVLALLGVLERGLIGTPVHCTSFAEFRRKLGGYTANTLDAVAAVKGFFDNGGQDLWCSRVVHCSDATDPTTKTSAAGTLELLTAATSPSPGVATSGAQPYALDHGQTLVISIDGGGDQTFTFSATAASRTSAAGTFNIPDLATLQIAINGSTTRTKIFASSEFVDNTAATAAEVCTSLNAFFLAQSLAALATVDTGAVKITTIRKGTGASVNVVGGTANAGILAFTTGAISGTGDASDISSTTAAEVAAKLSTLTGSVASVLSGTVLITSSSAGLTSTVQVKSASTADTGTGFDNAVHAGSDGTAVPTLTVDGKTDGAYANALSVVVSAATDGDATHFNLAVTKAGVSQERWANLSMDAASARYAPLVVNDASSGSDLIALTDELASTSMPRPASGTFGPLAGGDDGLVGLVDADFAGGESANGVTGLRTFDAVDVDLLIVPGRATSVVQNAQVTYCEVYKSGRLFTILDPPANQNADDVVTYVESTANLLELTDKAAIYWPRVAVANPDATLYGSDPTVEVPPSGHVAGVYARTDASKQGGAFEHPAGVDRGIPLNVLGLEGGEGADVLKKPKRDLVFPKRINPISQEPGTPIFIDGARTLKAGSPWPSVGQRRGVMFVEKRLIPGLAFMRHANIRDRLYQEGTRTVTAFLRDLTAAECFRSTDPSKAFFVDFGPGINTPSIQAQGVVLARIGLATSRPAEFIVLLIGEDTQALEEELAAIAAA